jgi:hypothetical protein
LGGRGRQIFELEASLLYIMSSRTTRAIQRNPVHEKQTNKHTHKNKKQKEKRLCWAGEMAWLRNTGCSSRGPQLYSQQPHGGSQPKPNHL